MQAAAIRSLLTAALCDKEVSPMRPKQIIRYITDLLMVAVIVALMAYAVTGQEIHEWLGVAAFLLFVLHHLLNWNWFRAFGKGKYTARRILQTALVLLLFFCMLAQMVSGIAMSRHTLPFLNVPISTSTARLLHLACGYWSFVLVSVHLGLHWGVFLGPGRRLRGGKALSAVGRLILGLLDGGIAVYGLYCFLQQKIPDYMFLRTEFVFFDYEKAALLVIVELLAIFALWVLAGCALQKAAAWVAAKKKAHKRSGNH